MLGCSLVTAMSFTLPLAGPIIVFLEMVSLFQYSRCLSSDASIRPSRLLVDVFSGARAAK